MTNFWKSHYNEGAELFQDSLCKQVGKTINGVDINSQQLGYIVDSIVEALKINKHDMVIDLCCGNGLITKSVSVNAMEIIGIDFSERLIDVAKEKSNSDNINYIASNVLNLPDSILNLTSKFYIYEALQHLTSEMFSELLDELNTIARPVKLFVGSVPDKEKLWDYYDTEEKKQFYLQREKENRPHMGVWWTRDEVRTIAENSRFNVAFFDQNPLLYTAYYRFNCLLEKKHE